jgi:site-specific DNA-cytosine methylase
MRRNFVDCQGLAGAWSLGTAQAGFDLLHRVALPGGFGNAVMEENRSKFRGLNTWWHQEDGTPADGWTPQMNVSFLCGTPPCSGFSLMNASKGENARGPGSLINNCMRELITYAGMCTGSDGRPGPEIVSFESVQGAYTQGRSLMVELLTILNELTYARYATDSRFDVPRYEITHVLMSGGSVGAAQMRHRYFPVFHRIPFGVDQPPERHVTTYEMAIGDLQGAKLQWEDQRYKRKDRFQFQTDRRRDDGLFDSHVTKDEGRVADVIHQFWDGWNIGENLTQSLERRGIRPPELEKSWNEAEQKYNGWSWPVKIRPDRCGYVLTGGAIHGVVHWAEPRLLTVRECSRLMGYPDAWTWPTGNSGQASMWIGKCCPVNSGQWLSEWALRALEGDPGEPGAKIGEDENLFNCTLAYKKWPGGSVPKRLED